jgi:hypothetical protein
MLNRLFKPRVKIEEFHIDDGSVELFPDGRKKISGRGINYKSLEGSPEALRQTLKNSQEKILLPPGSQEDAHTKDLPTYDVHSETVKPLPAKTEKKGLFW